MSSCLKKIELNFSPDQVIATRNITVRNCIISEHFALQTSVLDSYVSTDIRLSLKMLFGIIIGFSLLSILCYVILCMFYVIPDLFTVFVVVILLHSFLPRVERSRLFQRRESCHGTFGDRSPYLEQAYQYANTENNYVDVDLLFLTSATHIIESTHKVGRNVTQLNVDCT